MIMTVVFPAYFMAGYNNAVPGGLLSLDSFVKVFPTIDTVHTEGAARAHAATIQGKCDRFDNPVTLKLMPALLQARWSPSILSAV